MWDDVAVRILGAVGRWESSHRRPARALRAFEGQLAIWDALVLQYWYWSDPNDVYLLKRNQLDTIGEIIALQRRIGLTADALSSSRRAKGIAVELLDETPDDVNRLIAWGNALLTVGEVEREVDGTVSAETRASIDRACQRLERSPELRDASTLYKLASLYSRMSGLCRPDKAPSTDQARRERAALADRAMAFLHRAVAARQDDVSHMKHDPELDPLRSRVDFQGLLLDMNFPADPFAH
jgi:hypothetical protein